MELLVGLDATAFGDELLSGTQAAESLVREVPDLQIHLGRVLEIALGNRGRAVEPWSRALDGCGALKQLSLPSELHQHPREVEHGRIVVRDELPHGIEGEQLVGERGGLLTPSCSEPCERAEREGGLQRLRILDFSGKRERCLRILERARFVRPVGLAETLIP